MSDKRATAPSAGEPTIPREIVVALLAAERALHAGALDAAERAARAALADPRCAQALHLLGEVARRRGDLAAAERQYRKAIQSDARVPYFHHALGNVLQDRRQLDEAIAAYRRALRLAPAMAEAWNDLGTAYFASGQPQRAADCYRNALRHGAGHAIAAENLGAVLRSMGDVRGALRAFRHQLWLRLRARFARSRRPVGAPPSDPAGLAREARHWLERGNARLAGALADLALGGEPRNAQALAAKAELMLRAGKPAALLELLDGAPHTGELAALRGRAHMLLLQYGDAANALHEAVSSGVREPALQRELALSLRAADRADEALALLERAAPAGRSAELWTTLGRLRLDAGEDEAAFAALARALRIDPYHAPAIAETAHLRVKQRQAVGAVTLAELAVQRDPTCAAAHYWLGRALALTWQWEEACAAFREVLELGDDWLGRSAAVWLSNGLRTLEIPHEAEAVLRKAAERWPDDAEIAANLAMAIIDRGELARAAAELERVLELFPAHADALGAMCAVQSAEGDLARALDYAQRAIRLAPAHPIPHHNLGLTLLKMQRFDQGWDEYEYRKQLPTRAGTYLRFPYAEWDGSPLGGRVILLYAEQGLGDEIMFASCIPDVLAQSKRVIIECEPRLAALFRRSFVPSAVFGRTPTLSNTWTRSLDPQPDLQCALGSLPRIFRRRLEDFPSHRGYLQADPQKVARWRERLAGLGPGSKLGISWRGGLARSGRMRRSLELAQLEPLFAAAGAQFVNLQYGNSADELAAFERRHGRRVHHWPEALEDYDETAALVCALDGVVTVCTALVHLAGALGRPVLVMAPYSPEWRYGMSGESMPWYPSAQVLRQPRPGDWPAVLAQAMQTLSGSWEKS